MEDRGYLARKLHIKFFTRILEGCPAHLSEYDSYRTLFLFFCVSGLDMLNALDTLKSEFKKEIIEWVYHLQVLPLKCDPPDSPWICGFQGTSATKTNSCNVYETAHLTMTYTSLCTLVILGDDLSRVNKTAVLNGVKQLQNPDGSFSGSFGGESDMRFVYSAACVSYILNDKSCIDVDKMVDYILNSIGYDGAIAQGPGLETHGGSTFCGLAALVLTDNFHVLSPRQVERLKRWCIFRQGYGFQGRPNKPEDTCYSFWLGGALALLGGSTWLEKTENRKYIMSTQDLVIGGFAKWPGYNSDCLHAFFGLAGLSLNEEEGVAPIEPLLCITRRAHSFLKSLHSLWK